MLGEYIGIPSAFLWRLFCRGSLDWESVATISRFFAQLPGNAFKLLQRGFQVFDDFGGDDIRRGQVGGIFQGLVAQPEDVEIDFVAGDQFFVGEDAPAAGFVFG
jgi:hypothetical protein